MAVLTGILLFLIFLFLSGLHFYWGLGGKWGVNASIPTKENNENVLNPKLFDCFAVAFGLLGFGIFVLIKSGFILYKMPVWLTHYGLWAISFLFILRAIGEFKYVGFFKKIRTTLFAQMDTKYYSPLCLFIGFLGILLELIK